MAAHNLFCTTLHRRACCIYTPKGAAYVRSATQKMKIRNAQSGLSSATRSLRILIQAERLEAEKNGERV